MKTILCYGDSNTYGYDPETGLRYPDDVRWTGRLAKLLGNEYRVIEEGCNGRTTVFDDPADPWKNGLPYLRPCLNTHKPVDIVILMLGSNDLKRVFNASAEQIAAGAGKLVADILEFTKEKQGFIPKIILISPTEIGEGITTSPFSASFDENAISRSRELAPLYEKLAGECCDKFINAAAYIKPSETDSLHWTVEGHAKMAEILKDSIDTI